MSARPPGGRPASRPGGRIGDALFGTFLLGLAVAILAFAWDAAPWGAAVAALVVGLLGAEAVCSAWRDRPSLVARIGPLP